MTKSSPIGVFDSGIGGLTVLKKLEAVLPCENYIYFGDTTRVPYGDKTPEQLILFAREILDWFKSLNVKAVVMACNSSSAVVLDVVQDEYEFPILGIIQPAAREVASLNVHKIGVMATKATINSKAYSNSIKKYDSTKEVFEQACPGLVEFIEEDKLSSEEVLEKIKTYVGYLQSCNVEKIILGCTHYPYLKEIINEITGQKDLLVDPAEYLASELKICLKNKNLLNDDESAYRKYYVSANPDKFKQASKKLYPHCDKVELINI